MARKKETDPFVPVEEQPYKIPDNWCWVRLGKLYEINPKITAEDTALASFVPMERIEAGMTGLFSFEILPWGKARKGHTQFADGDVAFAKISPCFENRKSMIVQGLMNGIGGGTTELIILRQANMNQKYTFLLISTEDFISRGRATYSGTVGQQRISMDFVKMYPVPVPPLPEQQRIVSRIESLFAKLDESKEKAQAVVDGFELRKSAILHRAFTGELIGISGGSTVPLESIVDTIRIGPFGSALHKEDYITGGIPVVNPKHITNQQIVAEEGVTVSEEKASELLAYRIKTGDIVMGRRGEMGRSAPVTEKENGWLCGTGSLIIRLQDGLGSTMKNLNEKVIKSLPVPNYTKEQQQAIVTTLNSLLAKEQQAKEAAEAVLDQIDTMKKAILARAFRGELGTNDPAEESAEALVRKAWEAGALKRKRGKAVFIPKGLEMQLESELERKIIKLYVKSDSAALSIDELMGVSSKKFAVMEALRSLERKGIIKKVNNVNYTLVR